MLRLKRPADKGSESAAAILLITDALQKIDIPPEWQFRMMSALHQDLNPARRRKFIELPIDLLQRKHIMIFIFFGSIKRAEFAVNIADICVINVSIDNVSDDLAAASVVASRLCQVPSRICQSAQFLQRKARKLQCLLR